MGELVLGGAGKSHGRKGNGRVCFLIGEIGKTYTKRYEFEYCDCDCGTPFKNLIT